MMKETTDPFSCHQWVAYVTEPKPACPLTSEIPLDAELDEADRISADAFPCIAVDVLFNESPASLGTNLLSNRTTRKQTVVVTLLKLSLYKLMIYNYMSKNDFLQIFSGMPYHSRIELYYLLNDLQREQLVPFLTKRERELLGTYCEFLPGTAGKAMQKNCLVVLGTMSVGEVIEKIRPEIASQENLSYYVYVVNDNMQLMGCISLKELLLHFRSMEEKITQLLKDELVYLTIDDPKEAIVRKIEASRLVSLPVVNNRNQILGIVTHTNAMRLLRKEQFGDTDVLMGIRVKEEEQGTEYLRISVTNHLKKRIKWILIVFLAGTVSQVFLHLKEGFFMHYKLVLYIGMISDTGGNVGSQVASVVLQALTRGQTKLKDWFRIIRKEMEISSILACILFVVALAKIQVVSSVDAEAVRTYPVMFVVAFSLFLQIVFSAFLGAALPLAAKYLKGDPAIAANPIINTAVELLGALIYYFMIYWIIHPATVAPAAM